MKSTNQIKSGAIMAYIAILFNIIAGLVYTPWMVKQIGQSDFGLFVLVTSFLSYFIMDFGLGQAIARFIAKYRKNKEEEKINGLVGLTVKLYLLINTLIIISLIITFFFIENIFVEFNSNEIEKFKIIFCITSFFSIISFPFTPLNGVLIAFEKFVFLKVCDLVNKVLLILFMVIALYFGYKLYALVLVNAIVGFIIILLKLLYIKKQGIIQLDLKFYNKPLLRELFSFSIWVTIIGVAQRLLMNLAPTLLGIFSGTIQISIFAIGMTIEGYTWTFASALNGLFLPKVTEIVSKENNQEELTKLMIKVARIQLIMVGLLLVGMITLGQEFITLWMGSNFNNSYFVALFLILPGSITLTQEIGLTLLFVQNKLKIRAILLISASILSVILSIFLAPKYGAIGVSISIFISIFLFHVIGMNWLFWKVFNIDIPRFFRECYLKMLIPLTLSMLSGFIIQEYIFASNMLFFIPKIILLSISYCLFMWNLGLNSDEKKIFLSFFNISK